MKKVAFTDPDTQETVEFLVEDETQLNGIKYLLVSEEEDDGVERIFSDQLDESLAGKRD